MERPQYAPIALKPDRGSATGWLVSQSVIGIVLFQQSQQAELACGQSSMEDFGQSPVGTLPLVAPPLYDMPVKASTSLLASTSYHRCSIPAPASLLARG